MLAHTFRGTTWRSVLRLENDRDLFRRYRRIRDGERVYVDWPDPVGPPLPADHECDPSMTRLARLS